jgi:Kdo2-lipid IVA lauroyltransferase/acyltransferase
MKERLEYLLFLLLHQIARFVPFKVATSVGSALGVAVFRCTRIRRRVTMENLRHAFPEKSESELLAIARGAYRTYGISITQMLWAGGASADELISKVHISSREPLDRALGEGRGLLLMSAHFGSWELLPTSVRLLIGSPFVMIVQTQRNRRINALVDRLRSRFDNQTVPMGPSVRHILEALREKKIVLLLGDQSGPKESVFVDFFGRPAATHRGPAVFSLRNNTPIVMILLVRRPDGTYDAIFEELDRSGLEGSSEENILELTRRHTALTEKYIRKYPDHWLWMHKRWKHTPYFEASLQGARKHAQTTGGEE